MKDYRSEYEKKKITIPQALEQIQSGMNIYVGVDMAEPVAILQELHTIADRVRDVTVCTVLGPEDYPHLHDTRGNIRTEPFFYGPFTRRAHSGGSVSIVPHNISTLYRDRSAWRKPNVFIGVASPMDKHGFLNMGLCISH